MFIFPIVKNFYKRIVREPLLRGVLDFQVGNMITSDELTKSLHYKLFMISAKSDIHRITGDCVKELLNSFGQCVNPFQIVLEKIREIKGKIETAVGNHDNLLSEIESRRESFGHLYDAINVGGLALLKDITRKNESWSDSELSEENESDEFCFQSSQRSSNKDVQSYFFNTKSHFASRDYSGNFNSGMSLKENKSKFF